MIKLQGKFSGIKLYKFSTLMINARKPKPRPYALNFGSYNNGQKLMAREEKKKTFINHKHFKFIYFENSKLIKPNMVCGCERSHSPTGPEQSK